MTGEDVEIFDGSTVVGSGQTVEGEEEGNGGNVLR